VLTIAILTMPSKHQSKAAKATPVPYTPVPAGAEVTFKRCGHCGDKKPECRKQKKCLKDLL